MTFSSWSSSSASTLRRRFPVEVRPWFCCSFIENNVELYFWRTILPYILTDCEPITTPSTSGLTCSSFRRQIPLSIRNIVLIICNGFTWAASSLTRISRRPWKRIARKLRRWFCSQCTMSDGPTGPHPRRIDTVEILNRTMRMTIKAGKKNTHGIGRDNDCICGLSAATSSPPAPAAVGTVY